MSRALATNWLRGELAGPTVSRQFAREVLGAIEHGHDVSTAALQWLDRRAEPGGRWSVQANACLDELDRVSQGDAEPFAPPESGVTHV